MRRNASHKVLGMSAPRVIVVQNTPHGGPRRLGDWLSEDGLDLEVVHGYDGGAIPTSATGYDALVVLGGGYMPDDDTGAPWLAPTRDLMRSALDADLPVLGICLGGQMLAHVTGGAVRADAGAPEVGSTAITLRPEADDDALFGDLPRDITAVENHVDVIEKLPPEAVWLASSQLCPIQAFRVGRAAWGLQFHPETSADNVEEWGPEGMAGRGFDPTEVKQRTRAADPVAAPHWRRMTSRFAAVVAGRD